MLDKLEKIFSIITGILAIGIAMWVIITGQSQFKQNIKISEEQLQLYKTERQLTIESGSPILAIATSGFTPIFETIITNIFSNFKILVKDQLVISGLNYTQ